MDEQFKPREGRGKRGTIDQSRFPGSKMVVYKCVKCGQETVSWTHLIQSGQTKLICNYDGGKMRKK